MPEQNQNLDLKAKLHSETARIYWKELQRFFAQGLVFWLSDDHDIVDVAVSFAKDDSKHIEQLIVAEKLAKVSDEQARDWIQNDAMMWSVVVAPYVLVQCKFDQIPG